MVQNITGNMLCEIEQFIWPSTWWPLFIDSTHDLPYTFRFHDLVNKKGRKLEGYFAIDVTPIREPWRIILQPLDENKQPYSPCNIDEIAGYVKIVEIAEVSKHYE